MIKKRIRKLGSNKAYVFFGPPINIKAEDSKAKPLLESLRDVFGLVTTSASIFVVLLYLAGRSYAAGYFAAMNIPSYLLSFSLWEYGEVAWLPMLLYATSVITAWAFLSGLAYAVWDGLVTPLFQRAAAKSSEKVGKVERVGFFPKLGDQAHLAFRMLGFGIVVLGAILFVTVTLFAVYDFGNFAGRIEVLQNTAQVQLVSDTPLPLEKVSITTNAINNAPVGSFYVYNGFHLLTMNDGKYYLFRDIDPATCRPVQVFVIEADTQKQINLSAPVSLADQCKKK